jgi:hypothetical protein
MLEKIWLGSQRSTNHLSSYDISNDSNDNDDVNNDVLINKLEVECKVNMKIAQLNKFINLGYVDLFDYMFASYYNIDRFPQGLYKFNTCWWAKFTN